MSINNTLVQVMYRYLMHVSLYGCMYLFDHTTKTYIMAALTRFQFSEGIYFFCNILHNEKTQKYVCIIWRKIMASKGYFYDSDNDDQDDNNNLPFYYMH